MCAQWPLRASVLLINGHALHLQGRKIDRMRLPRRSAALDRCNTSALGESITTTESIIITDTHSHWPLLPAEYTYFGDDFFLIRAHTHFCPFFIFSQHLCPLRRFHFFLFLLFLLKMLTARKRKCIAKSPLQRRLSMMMIGVWHVRWSMVPPSDHHYSANWSRRIFICSFID